jgi:hypothetical protein
MIKKKMPRDIAQISKKILDITTGEDTSPSVDDGKNPHAVALGRLGGLKGGKARASKLTKKQRSEIARKAAKTRWSKKQ